jgi:hypothetical protein
MGVIDKSPNIAVLFGIIALATASVLVLQVPEWLNYVFALFWVITGLLGLFVAIRR